MSRYTCHSCNDEHDTDNVIAFCAFCYSKTMKELIKETETARKKIKNQTNSIEAMEEMVRAATVYAEELQEDCECVNEFALGNLNKALAKLEALERKK